MTETRRTTAHYVLEKDEFDPDDETLSSEELTRALDATLQSQEAYARGELPVRVTEFTDGKRVTYWRYKEGPVVDKYRILIEWSQEDMVYLASMPELPGCMADGKTPEEAIANLRVVANLWLDAAVSMGQEIPRPQSLIAERAA